MKKILITLCFLVALAANAQTAPNYDNYKLETPADLKAAEGAVLQASDYILSVPFIVDDAQRQNAMAFIIKWMTGTPDYTFTIDSNPAVMGTDAEMISVYVAAMCKFVLENKSKSTDEAAIKLASWKFVADYVANPAHKVTQTRPLKKLVEANKKGEMEKYIKDNPAK